MFNLRSIVCQLKNDNADNLLDKFYRGVFIGQVIN